MNLSEVKLDQFYPFGKAELYHTAHDAKSWQSMSSTERFSQITLYIKAWQALVQGEYGS